MFTEEGLENLFMDMFVSRGYMHLNGEEIERDTKDILIRRDLQSYLGRKYPGIRPSEIDATINWFQVLDRGDYVNNRETFSRIRDGFPIKREEPDKPPLWVNLVDFEDIDSNIFRIVNQYTIRGHKQERRPDAIVFINGIPLVVLEFKSSIREEATIHEAWDQLNNRYVRDIPNLFAYNAFVVISDGVNSKIGTHFSKYEHFYSWNKVNSTDRSHDGLDSIETLMEGVFTRERLLSIIRDFVYFPDESNSNMKIVCRYPQFFGANLLLQNIKAHMKPEGDGKGGTYFGTTGCGKSFTMLFLSRLLMTSQDLANPTIIVITDRNNLDHQLHSEFVKAKGFLRDQRVESIDSRKDLKDKLEGIASGGVFLTTVQKFSEDLSILSERNNIIVISDEAHRTQLNMEDADIVVDGVKKHITGFAKILHDVLPNATYVGFTGTPIDNTLEVFGDIVDQYTMVESERDEITCGLVYEGRASKVMLDSGWMQRIEEYYDGCLDMDANPHQVEKSKREISRMENIIGNDERISKVARDFVEHYEHRVTEGKTVVGKCMFVCTSRQIAFKLYCAIRELRPDWFEVREGDNEGVDEKDRATPIEMVKMVATRDKSDPMEMYEMLGNDDYKKDLDTQFKKPHSNFKIAIVVDMWLTGFDVPCLDTIYIDKPIQKHNLIQAISRVNRIFEGKQNGLIVDYLGIRKELDQALRKYTDGYRDDGFKDTSKFVSLFKEWLNIIDSMFHGFDTSGYFSGDVHEEMRCLRDGMEFIQRYADVEKRFMSAVRKLKTAYSNCSYSDDISMDERNRMNYYVGVRSLLAKIVKGDAPDTAKMNDAVREMLDRAIISDDVIGLVSSIHEMDMETLEILSEEYLDRVSRIPGLNTRFKVLQRLTNKSLDALGRTNRIRGMEFTERFNRIVQKYNDRHFRAEDIADLVQELTDFALELKEESSSGDELGITVQEKAFYDVLDYIITREDFEFDRSVLPDMAREMRECTDKACSVLDWKDRADIRARLKMDLAKIMQRYGFPPVYYNGVYEKVFEQIENYKAHS